VTTTEAGVQTAVDSVGVIRTLCCQAADAIDSACLQLTVRYCKPELVTSHFANFARGTLPMKMRRFLVFAVPRFRHNLRDLIA
jgi:hypothetical protein